MTMTEINPETDIETATCNCGPSCTCGCQDGQPCQCSTDSPSE